MALPHPANQGPDLVAQGLGTKHLQALPPFQEQPHRLVQQGRRGQACQGLVEGRLAAAQVCPQPFVAKARAVLHGPQQEAMHGP